MSCSGDRTQICGDVWGNSVYKMFKYNLRGCRRFRKMNKNDIKIDPNANTLSSPIPISFYNMSFYRCLILCTTMDDCNMLSFSSKHCTLFDSPDESVDALNSNYLTDHAAAFYKRKC